MSKKKQILAIFSLFSEKFGNWYFNYFEIIFSMFLRNYSQKLFPATSFKKLYHAFLKLFPTIPIKWNGNNFRKLFPKSFLENYFHTLKHEKNAIISWCSIYSSPSLDRFPYSKSSDDLQFYRQNEKKIFSFNYFIIKNLDKYWFYPLICSKSRTKHSPGNWNQHSNLNKFWTKALRWQTYSCLYSNCSNMLQIYELQSKKGKRDTFYTFHFGVIKGS